ncbi:hypothetical protein ACIBO2_05795 [Nonomuraea sp. NPDC050022]|uniref:hypothetical protein n=1 Tax=unclassified Nonomuraea TaxID=2593643 RepID=UPI0033D08F6E
MNMWVWSGSGSTFYLCDTFGWIYNTASVTRITFSKQYADPPCGDNYYLSQGFFEVKNSSWYGGDYMSDDNHYYPTTALAPSSPKAAAPPSLPDFSKMPAKVQKAGLDGKPLMDAQGNPVLVDLRPSSDMNTANVQRELRTDESGQLEERVTLR